MTDAPMRRCTKCGEENPATTEYFNKTGKKSGGWLRSECKICRNKYQRERLKSTDYSRKWHNDHPNYRSEYWAKNKDKLSEYNREWRRQKRLKSISEKLPKGKSPRKVDPQASPSIRYQTKKYEMFLLKLQSIKKAS